MSQRNKIILVIGIVIVAVTLIISIGYGMSIFSKSLGKPQSIGAENNDYQWTVYTGNYQVKSGDSLWAIAQKYRTDVNTVQSINNRQSSNYNIYVNQYLKVPAFLTGKYAGAPAPTPRPNPTPEPQQPSSTAQQILDLVNAERAKAGVAPLKLNTKLNQVAQEKARDMYENNYFSHNSPTYGSPFDMMKQFGVNYTYAGENIAKGFTSSDRVMQGWMNSPGHKANILNPNFTELGVGLKGTVWVQMFIKPF